MTGKDEIRRGKTKQDGDGRDMAEKRSDETRQRRLGTRQRKTETRQGRERKQKHDKTKNGVEWTRQWNEEARQDCGKEGKKGQHKEEEPGKIEKRDRQDKTRDKHLGLMFTNYSLFNIILQISNTSQSIVIFIMI